MYTNMDRIEWTEEWNEHVSNNAISKISLRPIYEFICIKNVIFFKTVFTRKRCIPNIVFCVWTG